MTEPSRPSTDHGAPGEAAAPATAEQTVTDPGGPELDVRAIPKPQRHPLIFARFDALAVGQSFVLVNSHDPKHLRAEFERDHPGAYEWTYLPTDSRTLWRIEISRRASTDLPRLLADSAAAAAGADGIDAGGAVWRLEPATRQLDANLIQLAPLAQIDPHRGPDLDVLVHVVSGTGQIRTEREPVELRPGALVWLPRRSQRSIIAGPDGLKYLSVHPRRPGLTISSSGLGATATTRP